MHTSGCTDSDACTWIYHACACNCLCLFILWLYFMWQYVKVCMSFPYRQIKRSWMLHRRDSNCKHIKSTICWPKVVIGNTWHFPLHVFISSRLPKWEEMKNESRSSPHWLQKPFPFNRHFPFYILRETKDGFASCPRRIRRVVPSYLRVELCMFPQPAAGRAAGEGWCKIRWILCVSYSTAVLLDLATSTKWISTNCVEPASSGYEFTSMQRSNLSVCVGVPAIPSVMNNVSSGTRACND